MKNQEDKLITVFSGNPVEAEMANQLLNENGIETLVKNRLMGTIAPWQVSPGGHAPVEILIHQDDEVKAIELLADFHK